MIQLIYTAKKSRILAGLIPGGDPVFDYSSPVGTPPPPSTPAFTYDQVSTPAAPAIGDTWRQRESSNLIIREWFWSGTRWLSIKVYITSYGDNNFRADALGGRNVVLPRFAGGIFFEKYVYSFLLGTNNTSNYYVLFPNADRTLPPNGGGGLAFPSFSTQNEAANQFLTKEVPINAAYIATAFAGGYPWLIGATSISVVGAPSVVGHARYTLYYREIYA